MKNWRDNFDLVGSFFEGRAWVEKDGEEGHVDKRGRVTTPLIYDEVGSFSNGRALVCKDGKEGHVDKRGKFVEVK